MTASDNDLHRHTTDRRQGPDLLLRILTGAGLGCWSLMVVAMVFLHRARPPLETVATRSANVYQRATWEDDLVRIFACLMLAGLLISTAGLALNALRIRRRDDRVRINLILIWLISLGGVIVYFFVR